MVYHVQTLFSDDLFFSFQINAKNHQQKLLEKIVKKEEKRTFLTFSGIFWAWLRIGDNLFEFSNGLYNRWRSILQRVSTHHVTCRRRHSPSSACRRVLLIAVLAISLLFSSAPAEFLNNRGSSTNYSALFFSIFCFFFRRMKFTFDKGLFQWSCKFPEIWRFSWSSWRFCSFGNDLPWNSHVQFRFFYLGRVELILCTAPSHGVWTGGSGPSPPVSDEFSRQISKCDR